MLQTNETLSITLLDYLYQTFNLVSNYKNGYLTLTKED